jgi:hypothetical protein
MPQLFNITLEHIIRKKKKITISLLDAIKEVGLETNTVHISSPKCRRSHNVRITNKFFYNVSKFKYLEQQ